MTIKQELLRRFFNCLGILCLLLGFCLDCRLLYVGTFIVYCVEFCSLYSVLEIFKNAYVNIKNK